MESDGWPFCIRCHEQRWCAVVGEETAVGSYLRTFFALAASRAFSSRYFFHLAAAAAVAWSVVLALRVPLAFPPFAPITAAASFASWPCNLLCANAHERCSITQSLCCLSSCSYLD